MTEQERKNIAEDVLKTIKDEGIAPRPLWHFTLKNLLLWVVGVVFLVCGAISVSLVILVLDHGLWEEGAPRGGGRIMHALQIFPFVWFGAFLLFLFVAEYMLSYTKRAYRYALTTVMMVLVLASIIAGTLLYMLGVSHVVDVSLERHMPRYEALQGRIGRAVHAPEQGRYAGQIIAIKDAEHLTLRNPHDGSVWEIDLTAHERRLPPLREGMHIVVRGALVDGVVEAHKCRPLLKKHERKSR